MEIIIGVEDISGEEGVVQMLRDRHDFCSEFLEEEEEEELVCCIHVV